MIIKIRKQHKMQHSPKCGLFPTVDKRHLEEGMRQEYQAQLKAEQRAAFINNVGHFLMIASFWSTLFYFMFFWR
jgi:hypothetical protein